MSTRFSLGFALPTVMIASVVMLMVLLSGLVAASSTNTVLREQFYQKLAKDAARAGSAHAQACLKSSNYVPAWSNSLPLKPNTNCSGVVDTAYSCPTPGSVTLSLEPRCSVVETDKIRTLFEVSGVTGSTDEQRYTVKGIVYMLRSGSRTLAAQYETTVGGGIAFRNNLSGSRPTQRYWYFGDRGGLDFNTAGTTATVVTAACPTGPCVAGEGSTAISSSAGVLRFWTDGKTIWDRNGQAMPNGTGLLANGSTTQAAAVFPAGFDESQYVIVSNNTENNVNNAGELYYSIVDMNLRSGLGDVTTKNIPVWSGVNDYASESTTAAPKANGKGYWIITNSPVTTHMRVFSYNSVTRQVDGVQTFNAPAGVSQHPTYAGWSGFGTLNFNEDYSKLILMAGDHCFGSCTGRMGLLRLMDFNVTTGAITNRNEWNNYSDNVGYSADFSPSGNYLYTTTIYNAFLSRYTLTGNTTNAAIKASEVVYGSTQPSPISSCTGGGQVRRAPNGKMYIANCGTNFLSVVNNPDSAVAGSAGFVYNGITLNPGTLSYYGLPQTITLFTPTLTQF